MMPSLSARKTLHIFCSGVVFASLLTLGGCEKLLGRENVDVQTPFENQEVSPTATDIDLTPQEIPPPISWSWAADSLHGWTFGALKPEVVFRLEGAGIEVEAPAEPAEPDVYMVSPIIKFEGNQYDRVLIDLEAKVAGTKNDLRLFYSTGSHGIEGDFVLTAQNGLPLSDGERRQLKYQVTEGSIAGDDWKSSTIQRIRFDLPQGAGSTYLVHEVRICSSLDPLCS